MPRNSGIYSLPSPPMPLVPNTLAAAEDINVTLSDIALALTGSVAADGSTPITGDINMNNHSIGGVNTLTTVDLHATGGAFLNYLGQALNANNQNITFIGNLTAASGTITTLNATNVGVSSGLSVPNLTVTNVANINALSASLNANNQNITGISTMQAAYVHSTGNGNVDGTLTVGNAVFAVNGLFAGGSNDATVGIYRTSGARVISVEANWYWIWDTSNGTMTWRGGGQDFWVMRTTDYICFNQLAAVGGNGAYLNFSDRRGKSVIGSTHRGLAEILQLQPVEFTRSTVPNPQVEIGFVAQDVASVIPEAVRTLDIDNTPMLALTYDTITTVMVAALKELAAAVKELAARVAALEGAAQA